jgi:hypothetical protein
MSVMEFFGDRSEQFKRAFDRHSDTPMKFFSLILLALAFGCASRVTHSKQK